MSGPPSDGCADWERFSDARERFLESLALQSALARVERAWDASGMPTREERPEQAPPQAPSWSSPEPDHYEPRRGDVG